MARFRSKRPDAGRPDDAAVVLIVETTAEPLPADGVTPLWATLPIESELQPGGAVLPFATTLRRVG